MIAIKFSTATKPFEGANRNTEAAALLRRIAALIEAGELGTHDHRTLHDSNGEHIGIATAYPEIDE